MALNVVLVERRFWVGRDAPDSAVGEARAIRLIESEGQRAAVRAVMETEIVPVLDSFTTRDQATRSASGTRRLRPVSLRCCTGRMPICT